MMVEKKREVSVCVCVCTHAGEQLGYGNIGENRINSGPFIESEETKRPYSYFSFIFHI